MMEAKVEEGERRKMINAESDEDVLTYFPFLPLLPPFFLSVLSYTNSHLSPLPLF